MPILKNVLGLDLGSHSIKAVEVQQTLRGIEAVQLQTVLRADSDLPPAELLARFLEVHGFSKEHVVAALPADRITGRRLGFPFREGKKLRQAVPFEVEGTVPFELEDLMIDWQRVGGDRNSSEVVAAIAPRSEVSEYVQILDEAGCPARTLEAEGLVLGNLAALFDLPGNRLLVDLGHRKTSFCLLVDGQPVATRAAAVGGQALTLALARDRGIGPEEAERLKCTEGVFLAGGRSAPPAAAAVLDQIAREVVRTLGSFEPVLEGRGAGAVAELTLFGGTSQLEGLDEHLAAHTGIPAARIGLPRPEVGQSLAAGGSPTLFAPAIALALRGTSLARTDMNFRQDEFAVRLDLGRYRKDFRWTGVLAACAALLAVVAFTTSTLLESRQADVLESEVGRLYQQAFPNEGVPDNPLRALREAVSSANDRADFLGVYRGNLSALDLLTEISKHVPPDLDIVLEELAIDRQTVRMRVYAKSFQAADRLGAELGKFAPFRQVRIGAIETDRKRGGKRFTVTITLGAAESSA